MAFVELDRVQQVLAEMNFPTLKQGQYLAAGPLADPYVNVGVTLRVAKQKLRQNTFDGLADIGGVIERFHQNGNRRGRS